MLILNEEIKSEILKHALTEQLNNRECCGVIYRRENNAIYARCRNYAGSNSGFVLNPVDYARIEDTGEILSIVHSHLGVSAKPSEMDVIEAEKSGLPWHIVSLPDKVFYSFKPDSYRMPLLERQFSCGYLDCFSLCRDYYNYELGILLKDMPREELDWWKKGKNTLEENFKGFDFIKVDDNDIKKHDVLLMNLESDIANHLAVYIGDQKIIHHLADRLSKTDPYGGYWQKHTFSVIRHKSML